VVGVQVKGNEEDDKLATILRSTSEYRRGKQTEWKRGGGGYGMIMIMTRLRIGHTTLNQSLLQIGKHESGNCDKCGYPETVNHIY